MIKILVDTLGGDNSPSANVDGAIMALNDNDDLCISLVGDREVLESYLKDKSFDRSRMDVIHAPDVISCNDVPTEAIRNKTESSLYKCYQLLRSEEEYKGMVSTGSTGAILAGAVLKLGRIKGVKRPALCPVLPTVREGTVCICDSGANADCDSMQLKQFAIMGNLFLKKVCKIQSPRVALLNIGTEEEKGNALVKETYPLLKNDPSINFVGNMEARELLSGEYDLVVCDGFSGNVLLKSTEGACLEMLQMLKGAISANLKSKIGALLLKKQLYSIKNKMDYNKYGGAVLLGTAKTVVKGHGSSKATSVFHCIGQAYAMEKNNLREAIAEEFSKPDVQ